MQLEPSKDSNSDANSAHLRRRACIPCTRAKRRCDMNRPACERCLDKQIACRYSMTRPYARRAAKLPQTDSPSSSRSAESRAIPLLGSSPSALLDTEDCHENNHGGGYSKDADYSTVSWFLRVEHWVIYHGDAQPPQLPVIRSTVLQQYNRCVRKWLVQWVELGHCPMIHRSLFAETGMPSCVQDAYAALAVYRMKNENNEETVMQHIQDKADALLQRHSTTEQVLLVGGFASVSPLSTIQHLARVLSLFIYVFIRLFDGHVRQRAEAEKLIPLLRDWTAQLWNSVNIDVTLQNAFGGDFLAAQGNPEAVVKLWRIWILMENVRRVWMVSTCTTCIYLVLRDGTGHCDGTIDFTARRGLWDAASAPLWKIMLEQKDALFVVPFQTAWLFERTTVKDIDPFGLTMMSLTLNSDKLDSWIAESTDTHLEELLMTV
ncbi:Transcription factor gsfR2 [Trichoderma ghanense]|uniref:Transcription factor gsfR2 n=1 Tax=Trichoderma ghanense TaxID=65468 RepID=A0ABY2GSX6_9HYPO